MVWSRRLRSEITFQQVSDTTNPYNGEVATILVREDDVDLSVFENARTSWGELK